MKIEKFDNGMLKIEPEGERTFYDIAMSDDLFWKDLSLYHSCMDGWTYLYDANRNLVYPMNDYGYDLIRDLIKGKSIEVMGKDNDSDYSDYEWNGE